MSLSPFLNPSNIEIGIDEAGRGCLAGPVVAAAVIAVPRKLAFDLSTNSVSAVEAVLNQKL